MNGFRAMSVPLVSSRALLIDPVGPSKQTSNLCYSRSSGGSDLQFPSYPIARRNCGWTFIMVCQSGKTGIHALCNSTCHKLAVHEQCVVQKSQNDALYRISLVSMTAALHPHSPATFIDIGCNKVW